MTLTIDDARLTVRKPGQTRVADTIPGGDIQSLDITTRIQNWEDDSTISYYNDGGRYTDTITSGDKLSVLLTFASGSVDGGDAGRYGETRFGETTYGGGVLPVSHRWRGWARAPWHKDHSRAAPYIESSVEAADWVFELLSERQWVFAKFDKRQLAGHEDAIVETLLRRHAPEIDREMIEPVRTELSYATYGKDLLSVMQELASRGDALLASRGDSLIFRPLEGIQPSFELRPRDYGTATLKTDDGSLKNAVRVDGAETPEPDQQTARGAEDIVGYERVTDTTRLTMPLDLTKTRLMRVDIWTRKQSDDNLRVRIQRPNEDGTGPIAPGDDRADLDGSGTGIAVSKGDWRRNIRLEKNTLPDRPWLIIDTDGDEGHDIGVVDDAGTPAIRTYYPHKILRTAIDGESISEYNRREIRLKKEDVATDYETAGAIAEAYLRHHKWPKKTLSFDAQSLRAHTLLPGGMIRVGRPDLGATGNYILVERKDEYSGDTNRLETSLALKEARSV
jgi:hypothetical protein